MNPNPKKRIDSFFAIPILQRNLEGMEEFNQNLIDNLDTFMSENPNKKPINWCCDLYVSGISDNLLEQKQFECLRKPILENVTKYCEFMDYNIIDYKIKIADCWLNVYNQGHTQEMHNHPGMNISGIYYPTSSELDGHLVFKSQYADSMNQIPLSKITSRNSNYVYFETEKSNILIFPSHLMHGVMPNKSERRVSISFNILLERF